MKLVMQIALGVFIGSMASQLTLDKWHDYKASKIQAVAEVLKAQQEQARKAQGDRIRELILNSRQRKPEAGQKPPIDFIPDDTQ